MLSSPRWLRATELGGFDPDCRSTEPFGAKPQDLHTMARALPPASRLPRLVTTTAIGNHDSGNNNLRIEQFLHSRQCAGCLTFIMTLNCPAQPTNSDLSPLTHDKMDSGRLRNSSRVERQNQPRRQRQPAARAQVRLCPAL